MSSRERLFYWVVGAAALLLSSALYLYGVLMTPAGHRFLGLTVNIDDSMVYLAWMRQAAEGSFFQKNLFTTEPQKGLVFNLWFLLLGNLARLTHLPLIAVYHLARVGAGVGLLVAVVRLLQEALADSRLRRLAFTLVCFGSGLGWLWNPMTPTLGNAPIDRWQPEVVTFQVLYISPLFAPALALMALFMASFLRAERTGHWRDLVPALVSGALLGNFHSYDVLQLFGAVGLYRILSDGLARKCNTASWLRLIALGAAAAPTVGYQFFAIRAEAVFYQRAFIGMPTITPAVYWVVAGFGLLGALAFAASSLRADDGFTHEDARRFLLTWAVVGIVIAYVPVAFQRKLMMGAQLPIAILAGASLGLLIQKLPGNYPKLVAFLVTLVLALSNLLWLMMDLGRLDANVSGTHYQPYISDGQAEALQWLKDHAQRTDVVLCAPDPTSHKRFPFIPLMPTLAACIPSLGNGIPYVGHWSETTAFENKLRETNRFFRAEITDNDRRAFLAQARVRYILYMNALAEGPIELAEGRFYAPVAWSPGQTPPYLTPVFTGNQMTIYEVVAQ